MSDSEYINCESFLDLVMEVSDSELDIDVGDTDSSLSDENEDQNINCDITIKEWKPTDTFFRIYQDKVRTDKDLMRYVTIKKDIMGLFFFVKDHYKFSIEEILLAVEVFHRLIMQDFLWNIEHCCELKEERPSLFDQDQWSLTIQQLKKNDCLNFITALILAKKILDGRCIITSKLIKNILLKSEEPIDQTEIVDYELKVLEQFKFNINFPLISTYCNLLFEIVNGAQYGVMRDVFYDTSYELFKIYLLNQSHFKEFLEMPHISIMELISAGIICAVLFHCPENEDTSAITVVAEKLEFLINIKQNVILQVGGRFLHLMLNI